MRLEKNDKLKHNKKRCNKAFNIYITIVKYYWIKNNYRENTKIRVNDNILYQ